MNFRHRNMKKKRSPLPLKILTTLNFFLRGYSWSQTRTTLSAKPWSETAGCWSPSRSWTTPSWSGSTTSTWPPRSVKRLWRMNPLSRSQIRSRGRELLMRNLERDLWRILQPWRAFRYFYILERYNASDLMSLCNRQQVIL